jgi:ribosomal protein S27E
MAQVKGSSKAAAKVSKVEGNNTSMNGVWSRMIGMKCPKCGEKSVMMNLQTGEVKCSYVKCGAQIKPPGKGAIKPPPSLEKSTSKAVPLPPVTPKGKVPLPPIKGKKGAVPLPPVTHNGKALVPARVVEEDVPEPEDIVDVEIINIAEVNVKDEKLMKRLQKVLVGGEDTDIYVLAEEYEKSKPKDEELAAIFDAVPSDIIQEVRDVCFYYAQIVELK